MGEENRLRMMNLREKKLLERMMADDLMIPNNIFWEVLKGAVEQTLICVFVGSLIYGILVFAGFSIEELNYEMYAILMLLLWSIISQSYKTVSRWRIMRKLYFDDINSGQVKESNYLIINIKIGQYPNCDGVVYFLLLDDCRVFVLFDDKNKDRSLLLNNFEIYDHFGLVKSKFNDRVINVEFSGHCVPVAQRFVLSDELDNWPDDEDFCDVPWDDIEKTYKT